MSLYLSDDDDNEIYNNEFDNNEIDNLEIDTDDDDILNNAYDNFIENDNDNDTILQSPQPPLSPPPPSISTDIIPNLPQQQNLSHFQTNLNTFYKKFTHDLTFLKRALPLSFYFDYDKYKIYETSNKILVPRDILEKTSEYEDLELPIYVKINDSDKIFGVIDYVDYIEHIYIPTPLFFEYNLKENEDIVLTIVKNQPEKASSITLKPLNEEFYLVEDIKTYLEVWLKKMFLTLHEGEIITLPYADSSISIFIDKLEPTTIVSIYEIEEVNIDMLPMDEYLKQKEIREKEELKRLEALEKQKNENDSENASVNANNNTSLNKNVNTITNTNSNTGFVAFSGKGRTLGSS